jgi:hypothetical protein
VGPPGGDTPETQPTSTTGGTADDAPVVFDRQLVLDSLGGWRGMFDATVPTLAFLVGNSTGGLRAGIWAALGAALLVFLLRLLRRESTQQAVGGLFAVGIAVAIAAASGQARGFFVWGMLRSAAAGVILLASVALRRPLIGVIAEFLSPSHQGGLAAVSLAGLRRRGPGGAPSDPRAPLPDGEPERHWRDDPRMLRAYSWLTVLWAGMFLLRILVQWPLYQADEVEMLATASLVLGYPLIAVVAAVTVWVTARLHRHRSTPTVAEAEPGD